MSLSPSRGLKFTTPRKYSRASHSYVDPPTLKPSFELRRGSQSLKIARRRVEKKEGGKNKLPHSHKKKRVEGKEGAHLKFLSIETISSHQGPYLKDDNINYGKLG